MTSDTLITVKEGLRSSESWINSLSFYGQAALGHCLSVLMVWRGGAGFYRHPESESTPPLLLYLHKVEWLLKYVFACVLIITWFIMKLFLMFQQPCLRYSLPSLTHCQDHTICIQPRISCCIVQCHTAAAPKVVVSNPHSGILGCCSCAHLWMVLVL